MSTLLAAGLVSAVLLQQPGKQQPAPEQLCGRVVSIMCAGPEAPVTLTVHLPDGKRQFKVLIRSEHREVFGPGVRDRYDQRRVCAVPRAMADGAVVVQSPDDLQITGEPVPPIPPLPDGVVNGCDAAVANPTVLKETKPDFSSEILTLPNGITITIRAVVNTDGTVGQIVVLNPTRPGIDKAAVDAVRRWRFRPATLEGVPVAIVVYIEFTHWRR